MNVQYILNRTRHINIFLIVRWGRAWGKGAGKFVIYKQMGAQVREENLVLQAEIIDAQFNNLYSDL